MDIAGCGK